MWWWNCAPLVPCNLDPFSRLWRTVWVLIYLIQCQTHSWILYQVFHGPHPWCKGQISMSNLSCPTYPDEWWIHTSTLDIREYAEGLFWGIGNVCRRARGASQRVWTSECEGMEMFSGCGHVLNSSPCRMHSGTSKIQTHTRHFHLTVYTQTILACLEITYGNHWNRWLRQKGDKLWIKLTTSKCKSC